MPAQISKLAANEKIVQYSERIQLGYFMTSSMAKGQSVEKYFVPFQKKEHLPNNGVKFVSIINKLLLLGIPQGVRIIKL